MISSPRLGNARSGGPGRHHLAVGVPEMLYFFVVPAWARHAAPRPAIDVFMLMHGAARVRLPRFSPWAINICEKIKISSNISNKIKSAKFEIESIQFMSMNVNTTISVEPFKRLVKLAARAFYDDVSTKGENQSKNNARGDNKGIAVVVLDALTRRPWVNEEALAKDLKIHIKQLRRVLRLFEEDKLLTRAHRKETAKITKKPNAGGADGQKRFGREDDKNNKLHTHSYCCLDYAQIYDVVRYRLHRMRKMIKDELENNNAVQQYICPNCGRRYNALDALRLISLVDEYFHCENCEGVLVAESDKLAAQEGGDGDDNARRRRREKLKDMLQNMEVQLKPLMDQLSRVKDLPIPEIGSLQAWQLHENAAGRAINGDPSSDDHFKYSQGSGYGGTPMPFLGETKVEVAFAGDESKEGIKSETASSSLKVLPPWMIKQGMNLTKEQRGEVKKEGKMDSSSAAVEFSDEKKSAQENDDSIKEEYVKAYYAALLEQQRQAEESAKKQQELSQTSMSNDFSESASNRQVGKKAKREEGEGDDDVEWEEAPIEGNTSESYRLNDLNDEAPASGEEDDDIDWEEG